MSDVTEEGGAANFLVQIVGLPSRLCVGGSDNSL